MKNLIHTLIGAIATFVAVNVAKRYRHLLRDVGVLQPAQLAPGPWYAYYMGDFMVAFETDNVTSAIVNMADGGYLWATATPEWDRDWFEEEMGWEFPERWVPYTDLAARDIPINPLG